MHVKTVAIAVCSTLLACSAGGCGGSSKHAAPPQAPLRIALRSTAFAANSAVPRRYTCDGAGAAPPLAWSRVPAGTRELALLVQDPDAPGGFTHWVVYAVSPGTRGFPGGRPPRGSEEGRNDSGSTGWTPPCPPRGSKPHHYVFTLLALSKPVGLPPGAGAADLSTASSRVTLAEGRLVGVYAR